MNTPYGSQPFNAGDYPSLAFGGQQQPMDLLGTAFHALTLRDLAGRMRRKASGKDSRQDADSLGWQMPEGMDRAALDQLRGMTLLRDFIGSGSPFGSR